MSIELFVLVNLGADLALLGAVARSMGRFDGRRILLAAALSTGLSVLAAARPSPWTRLLAMPVLPVALVIGAAPPALHMKALMLTMAGALLSGGLSLLAPFAARVWGHRSSRKFGSTERGTPWLRAYARPVSVAARAGSAGSGPGSCSPASG